mmetsp:Transcript_58543/g.87171  ORF Transcript_58543/g.87171 Transcript_58543/m.87171 type:complete len:86 (+) Transcript_58543:768-1025(+)
MTLYLQRSINGKKEKSKVTGVSKLRDMKGNKKKELWLERVLVAYDLSSALKYLHSLNILYRDLVSPICSIPLWENVFSSTCVSIY